MSAKKLILFAAVVLSLGQIGHADDVSITQKYIDYRTEGDKFVVIGVQGEGMDKEQAKENALKRAAQIALENGYSSFSIESETEVTVFQSKPEWPSNPDFPGNLYQEDIREQGFDRDRIISQGETGTRAYPGLQIIMEGHNTAPSGNNLNPCDYTDCNKAK